MGRLTISHVKATFIEGDVIVDSVHVFVDGGAIASCTLDELELDECGKDVPLAAGPHHLTIGIRCRNARTLGYSHPNGDACEFTLDEELVVQTSEAIDLDLARATRNPRAFSSALTRVAAERSDDDCHSNLDALIAESSCQAAGLDKAAGRARLAQEACAERADESDVRALVEEAFSAHFRLAPERCFPRAVLERGMPGLLTGHAMSWPAQTLPEGQSTWGWVRDTLSPMTANETRRVPDLAAVVEALDKARTRAVVFDQLIAAFYPKDEAATGLNAVLRAAERAPFSLDPREVEGHRNLVLVATETFDARYQDFVARGVLSAGRLHCDRYPLASQLSLFFTRGGLSPTEWSAVQALMRRTPPTSRVHECDYAFREYKHDQVPLGERLRWLFHFDCATDRHPTLRGDRAEVHLRPESTLSPALRQELLTEFHGCLAERCARESCSWFPER